ncbi:1436_t:CDS:1 [Cetraspora pellucida]|uniref:1436_t:CDS:1 n=1 Tax=Cetraspora pellucida TaxID=1433469 RepID=A0A9N9HFH0_9GLOM|nr:1436_t:CDS:1 [Cetraspora pellucida]
MSAQPQSTLAHHGKPSNGAAITFDPINITTNSTIPAPENQTSSPTQHHRPVKSKRMTSSFFSRRRSEFYDDDDEFYDGCCGSVRSIGSRIKYRFKELLQRTGKKGVTNADDKNKS